MLNVYLVGYEHTDKLTFNTQHSKFNIFSSEWRHSAERYCNGVLIFYFFTHYILYRHLQR